MEQEQDTSRESKDSKECARENISKSVAIPPNSVDPPNHGDNAQEACETPRKNILEIATFIAAVVAAVAAVFAATFTGYQAKIARDTFIFTNRPYIGIDKITVTYSPHDPEGHATPETHKMMWRIDIKNYGLLPGKEFRVTWHSYINGIESPMEGRPDSLITLFPSQVVHIEGGASEPNYSGITGDTKDLELVVQVDYDGPMGHDSYCEKARYSPTHDFYTFSTICKL